MTNIHVYTRRERNFKTSLKENYAIALDSCCLFTKKILNMELNMILIVLMEFAYIRHSWNLQQIWWIPCNLSKWRIWQSVSFPLSVYVEPNFLLALVALEYWEALEQSEVLILNEIGYCRNAFVTSKNKLLFCP